MKFLCPYCGQRLSVEEPFPGDSLPCPACGNPVTPPPGEGAAGTEWKNPLKPAEEAQTASSPQHNLPRARQHPTKRVVISKRSNWGAAKSVLIVALLLSGGLAYLNYRGEFSKRPSPEPRKESEAPIALTPLESPPVTKTEETPEPIASPPNEDLPPTAAIETQPNSTAPQPISPAPKADANQPWAPEKIDPTATISSSSSSSSATAKETPSAPPGAKASAIDESSKLRPDKIVYFDTSAAGEDKAITTWGMGTVGGPGIIQSGLANMGADQIDVILMPFPVNEPLTEKGELTDAAKAQLDAEIATAKVAGDKPWALSSGTGGGVNPWYMKGPNRVNAERWADCMIATKKYLDHPIAWAQPFNEPDWAAWGQGTPEDLENIMSKLKRDASFKSTQLAGPAVLNIDNAFAWWDPIKNRADLGTMHILNGSFDSYVKFIKTVKRTKAVPFNPEIHNLVEAIAGAEYGLEGGIWWLAADEARGSFAKACQGKRLGYAEVREKWSAAAVYRSPNGAVMAFLGSAERTGQETTYRFVCKDREVYFDGNGPRKEYTITLPREHEKMVKITW